jgi:hypothetical protein
MYPRSIFLPSGQAGVAFAGFARSVAHLWLAGDSNPPARFFCRDLMTMAVEVGGFAGRDAGTPGTPDW